MLENRFINQKNRRNPEKQFSNIQDLKSKVELPIYQKNIALVLIIATYFGSMVPLSDTEEIPIKSVVHLDPVDTSCAIEIVADKGPLPFTPESFAKQDLGHVFAIIDDHAKHTTYGMYPKNFSTSGQDGVLINSPKDLELLEMEPNSLRITSKKISIRCTDLLAVREAIQKASQELTKYKLNANYPFGYLKSRENGVRHEGNCVTFVKEFLKLIQFIDEDGNEIKMPLPKFDIPRVYNFLIQQNRFFEQYNAGDPIITANNLATALVRNIFSSQNSE